MSPDSPVSQASSSSSSQPLSGHSAHPLRWPRATAFPLDLLLTMDSSAEVLVADPGPASHLEAALFAHVHVADVIPLEVR